jgi:FemAB family protein
MNIKFISRSNNNDLWNKVLDQSKFFSVFYENFMIDYQIEYQKFYKKFYVDDSKIIFFNNQAVAVWPITLINSKKIIDSFGQPILPPQFISALSKKIRKEIIINCFEYINNFCRNNKIRNWYSQDNFSNSLNLSDWHICAAKTQAAFKISYEIYCNLSLKLEDIKSNFRRRYKNIINNSIKVFDVGIVDSKSRNKEIYWDAFKKLHLKLAKKETKSEKSWQLLYESLKENKSFLVYSTLKKSDVIIGGGLFLFSRFQCNYGIGVYDFENYDKTGSRASLGHIVQYKAIEEMKRRNFLWYNIGNRPFNKILNKSSKKLEDIANFKEGFSTDLLPHYLIKHSILKNVK